MTFDSCSTSRPIYSGLLSTRVSLVSVANFPLPHMQIMHRHADCPVDHLQSKRLIPAHPSEFQQRSGTKPVSAAALSRSSSFSHVTLSSARPSTLSPSSLSPRRSGPLPAGSRPLPEWDERLSSARRGGVRLFHPPPFFSANQLVCRLFVTVRSTLVSFTAGLQRMSAD